MHKNNELKFIKKIMAIMAILLIVGTVILFYKITLLKPKNYCNFFKCLNSEKNVYKLEGEIKAINTNNDGYIVVITKKGQRTVLNFINSCDNIVKTVEFDE